MVWCGLLGCVYCLEGFPALRHGYRLGRRFSPLSFARSCSRRSRASAPCWDLGRPAMRKWHRLFPARQLRVLAAPQGVAAGPADTDSMRSYVSDMIPTSTWAICSPLADPRLAQRERGRNAPPYACNTFLLTQDARRGLHAMPKACNNDV